MPRKPASLPDIPSPCVGVCALDPATGLCRGCLRTGEEIQAWPRADNAWRHETVQKLKERRVAAGQSSPRDLKPRRRRSRG